MTRKMKRAILGFPLLVLLFAVVACGRAEMPAQTATAVPTVDTKQIVTAVLTQIEEELSSQLPTAMPTVDVEKIKREVLEAVESQLEQSTPTPVPTIDTEELVAAVRTQFEEELEDALIDVYGRTNPAVVLIEVPPFGAGSGFVYDKDGHIVTNNHVVAVGLEYEVVFSNGDRVSAELVGTDIDSDLAVIKVDELPAGVEPLPLADPNDLQVGQFAVAIGNPFGEQGSMSLGIVSALGRSLRSQRATVSSSTYSLPQVIQTDAPINPGNSGGPLLNLDGEVIGVNAAIASRTGTNSGVGFSIPVAAVRKIIPSLIEDGSYVYPYLGVGFDDEISLNEQAALGLPQAKGAYVVGVTPGSPAENAGLIPADPTTGQGGDLIVKINDQEINSFSDLNSYLVFQTTVGEMIEITVLRNGDLVQLPLTLGARP